MLNFIMALVQIKSYFRRLVQVVDYFVWLFPIGIIYMYSTFNFMFRKLIMLGAGSERLVD